MNYKKLFLLTFLTLALICFSLLTLAKAEDLLIITPHEFRPIVQALADHKNASGMPTLIIELEFIYIDSRFAGFDIPERIKRAIKYYVEHNSIKYVMLVGDVDKFPVRWVANAEPNNPDLINKYLPSDLYYADIYNAGGGFCSWDYEPDGHFGEHLFHDDCASNPYTVNADRADLHPDVAVGRVPASHIEEVRNYVSKVITYEYMTATDPNDWFHNVLLMAGSGSHCDAGIHFRDIQDYLGTDFSYRTFFHRSYYDPNEDDDPYTPCDCDPNETDADCMTRTQLTSTQIDLFQNADGLLNECDDPEFINIGFLGWHDHTNSIRDYFRRVNNSNKFTIAFTDGCGDGAFAGSPVGEVGRFAPTSSGGEEIAYRSVDGSVIRVIFEPHMRDGKKYYRITGCEVDGTLYPRVGDHCAGVLPEVRFQDDFTDDTLTTLVNTTPLYKRGAYVYNLPPPDSIQPSGCDSDRYNPEPKLFAHNTASGANTGWVGLVAGTKGVSFPINGELETQFFRSYNSPHSGMATHILGDMWVSMIDYWLDDFVFDASGYFDLSAFLDKFDMPPTDFNENCRRSIQHTMMYALFGDPSLRCGGLTGHSDHTPPVTRVNADGLWHNHDVGLIFSAIDYGTPASGVMETRYRIDNRDWETGSRVTIEAPSDHTNDGIHVIEYYSVDFLGNEETPTRTAEVKIDTLPPGATVLLDGESPGSMLCMCALGSDCDCPDRRCYIDKVTVTLAGTDGVPRPSPHEQWNRVFGGGFPYTATSVRQTSDEGYIIAGWGENGGTGIRDLYVLKTDSEGIREWSHFLGEDEYDDAAFCAQQTSDGGYIVAGKTESSGAGWSDVCLIKFNARGDSLWNRTFGGLNNDYGYSVQETSDGGFIIAGSIGNGALKSAWLIKTDPNGDEEWNGAYGGDVRDTAYAVQQTTDMGYILAGRTESYGGGNGDVWLIKTDPNGYEEWNRTFGGSGDDYALSVLQSADGGYIMAGVTGSYGAGGEDGWLIKTDPNGHEEWNRTFGGTGDDYFRSIQQNPYGGYVLAGDTDSSGAGMEDVWLIQIDPNGDEEWALTFGGADRDAANSVELTADGGLILAGFTNSNREGPRDGWYIKIFFNIPVASGYDHSEYIEDAVCPWGCTASGPFDIHARDVLADYILYYWSVDAAGNESPHRHTPFCINNWEFGMLWEDAEILRGLEEIIEFVMTPSLDLPFDPHMIKYEYAGPIGEGEPEWMTIAVDNNGDDGWSALWDTTTVPDGDYLIRMTATGNMSRLKGAILSENFYQEEFEVTVCNIPESDYELTLSAPNEVGREESIQYTLTFLNQTDQKLANVAMTCNLSLGSFMAIDVLDNGTLNEKGMPTWTKEELAQNEAWTVHVAGQIRQDIPPGAIITAQAWCTADTISLLVSDNLATEKKGDYTAVAIKLMNASLSGEVRESLYGTPLSAKVTISGLVSGNEHTNNAGRYAFSNLPPGTYQVEVTVKGYEYYTPAGPLTRELKGDGRGAEAHFLMKKRDAIPPVTEIDFSMEEILRDAMTQISGTAYDYLPGSGLNKVEINIMRFDDGHYWDGNSWGEEETWLMAAGTSEWLIDCDGILWESDSGYAMQSRATDKAGNVGATYYISNTQDLMFADEDYRLGEESVTYVPDDFPTIQQALSSADSGDTIIVRDGSYNENVVIQTERITLKSENGRENCTINANGSGMVVHIDANQVELRGFTIRNSGPTSVGIYVPNAKGVTIADNLVTECKYSGAIYLVRCSAITVENNIVTDNDMHGISLMTSSHCVIRGNDIHGNDRHGIHIDYVSYLSSRSTYNNITNNTLRDNGYGSTLPGQAMVMNESSYNVIANNTFENNFHGITLSSSNNNTIAANHIKDSAYGLELATGYKKDPCINNTIYNNRFESENYPVNDAGTNTWNIDKTAGTNIIGGPFLGGNYWKGYSSTDSNNDGLGDTSYAVTGIGNNEDHLPLISWLKPDLVITEIWNDNGIIHYGIKNMGNAPAPAGHHTVLYIDGIDQGLTDAPVEELIPGDERFFHFLNYLWTCEGTCDKVIVCADHNGYVSEKNETNNCLENLWLCLEDNCTNSIDDDGDGDTDCDDSDCTADFHCIDGDGDGYTADVDCNDDNKSIYPSAPEICDSVDNNCNGNIDEEGSEGCWIYYKDEDQDLHGVAGDSRCLCGPDESSQYTALYSGDPDDSDPNILGTILTGHIYLSAVWSMISLPLIPENASVSSLFPDAVVVYGYEKGKGYVRVKEEEKIKAGLGYWILLKQAKTFSITGEIIDIYNLSVHDGWYMIGGCTSVAKASGYNCNIGVICGYEQESGYKRIQEGENLKPGNGYWILFNDVMDQAELTVEVIDTNI